MDHVNKMKAHAAMVR